MRWLTLALAVLLILVQYSLWMGKGSWFRVAQLEEKVQVQRQTTARLKVRNDALSAEVTDLKTGTEAIEERARSELGMVKADEIFVQVIDIPKPAAQSADRIGVQGSATP
ncbi:MAG: cell division protein FtsB [Pseudomonadota bacterium]|nr:cell division protein FtsB [Pseudomonadota bacterium]